MKNILCFGDSNTFGSHPLGGRHPRDIRWTGRLQALLGEDYHVIEEGLGGRTTVFRDEVEPFRTGTDAVIPVIDTHKPLDLIIVMLGTNDMKHRFQATLWDLSRGAERLLRMIQSHCNELDYPMPKILLVSPIHIKSGVSETFGCFTEDAKETSEQLSAFLKPVAEKLGCHFLDAADYAKASEEDRLHMNAENHEKLALALFDFIKGLSL